MKFLLFTVLFNWAWWKMVKFVHPRPKRESARKSSTQKKGICCLPWTFQKWFNVTSICFNQPTNNGTSSDEKETYRSVRISTEIAQWDIYNFDIFFAGHWPPRLQQHKTWCGKTHVSGAGVSRGMSWRYCWLLWWVATARGAAIPALGVCSEQGVSCNNCVFFWGGVKGPSNSGIKKVTAWISPQLQ